METKKFQVLGTREGDDGRLHCTNYHLDDLSTKWHKTTLTEEEIQNIGLTKGNGASKPKRHFSEV